MSLVNMRNAQSFDPRGGDLAFIKQVTSAGADLGTPDTFHSLAHLLDSELNDNFPPEKYKLESGYTVYGPGTREVTWTLTFAQRDEQTLQLAPVLSQTNQQPNFYALLIQRNIALVNGLYQYYFCPLCFFDPTLKHKTSGNQVQATIYVLPMVSNLTQSTWSGVAGTISSMFPTGASIAITTTTNPYYTLYTAIS